MFNLKRKHTDQEDVPVSPDSVQKKQTESDDYWDRLAAQPLEPLPTQGTEEPQPQAPTHDHTLRLAPKPKQVTKNVLRFNQAPSPYMNTPYNFGKSEETNTPGYTPPPPVSQPPAPPVHQQQHPPAPPPQPIASSPAPENKPEPEPTAPDPTPAPQAVYKEPKTSHTQSQAPAHSMAHKQVPPAPPSKNGAFIPAAKRVQNKKISSSRRKLSRKTITFGAIAFGFAAIVGGILFVAFQRQTPDYIDKSLPAADQQRQKDLHTIQQALFKYYEDNNQQYPILTTSINGTDDPLTLTLTPLYLRSLPTGPDQDLYYYASLTGKSFLLRARLSSGQNYDTTDEP